MQSQPVCNGQTLDACIEALRDKLHAQLASPHDLTSAPILALSEKLDRLILHSMIQKLDTSRLHAGGAEARTMVAICQVSLAELSSQVASCPDQESAAYEVGAIASALGLPLYDGADARAVPVAAEGYINLDWDGTDRYAEAAALARRTGAAMPQVGVVGGNPSAEHDDRRKESPDQPPLRVIPRHQAESDKADLDR